MFKVFKTIKQLFYNIVWYINLAKRFKIDFWNYIYLKSFCFWFVVCNPNQRIICVWHRSSRYPVGSDRRHWWRDAGPPLSEDASCVLRHKTQHQTSPSNQLRDVKIIPSRQDRRRIFWIHVPDDVPDWGLAESDRSLYFANVISVWSHPHNISSSQIQRCRHIKYYAGLPV